MANRPTESEINGMTSYLQEMFPDTRELFDRGALVQILENSRWVVEDAIDEILTLCMAPIVDDGPRGVGEAPRGVGEAPRVAPMTASIIASTAFNRGYYTRSVLDAAQAPPLPPTLRRIGPEEDPLDVIRFMTRRPDQALPPTSRYPPSSSSPSSDSSSSHPHAPPSSATTGVPSAYQPPATSHLSPVPYSQGVGPLVPGQPYQPPLSPGLTPPPSSAIASSQTPSPLPSSPCPPPAPSPASGPDSSAPTPSADSPAGECPAHPLSDRLEELKKEEAAQRQREFERIFLERLTQLENEVKNRWEGGAAAGGPEASASPSSSIILSPPPVIQEESPLVTIYFSETAHPDDLEAVPVIQGLFLVERVLPTQIAIRRYRHVIVLPTGEGAAAAIGGGIVGGEGEASAVEDENSRLARTIEEDSRTAARSYASPMVYIRDFPIGDLQDCRALIQEKQHRALLEFPEAPIPQTDSLGTLNLAVGSAALDLGGSAVRAVTTVLASPYYAVAYWFKSPTQPEEEGISIVVVRTNNQGREQHRVLRFMGSEMQRIDPVSQTVRWRVTYDQITRVETLDHRNIVIHYRDGTLDYLRSLQVNIIRIKSLLREQIAKIHQI